MQLMIDISQETPAALRLAAQLLLDSATLKEREANGGVDLPPVPVTPAPNFVPPSPADVPAGTSDGPFIPPAPAAASPVPSTPDAPTAPTAPPAPTATPAPAPASIPSAPPAATTAPSSASPATTTSGAIADEYDSAGMPWDARIHQSGKGKKKDGTWKLKKGIDPAIVAQITQELHAAGRVRSPGAAPTAPSVPPAPEVPAAPSFQAPQTQAAAQAPYTATPQAQDPYAQAAAQNGQAAIPPPPPVAPQGSEGAQIPPPPVSLSAAPVPVPPTANVGMPDAGNSGMVQAVNFRSLVAKITKARTENKLTAEEVSSIVQSSGAPNLQMLANMAHLVPVVDSIIDATLATR